MNGVPVSLSIFPDRDGADEDYTLTIAFVGHDGLEADKRPWRFMSMDLDLQRTNDFAVIENYDRDVTGFFTNPVRRALVKQAADDWAYFFTA